LTEAVALGTELLSVASRAVDLLVGTLAAVARVEILGATVALEATLVPWLEKHNEVNTSNIELQQEIRLGLATDREKKAS
jgi:hypothetical protein